MHQNDTRPFLLTLLLTTVCLAGMGQAPAPVPSRYIGRWAHADTAFFIDVASISRLYRVDTGWKASSFPNETFFFIDSSLQLYKNGFSAWIQTTYTSRRDYLLDGSEQSVETAEYRFAMFEDGEHGMLKASFSESIFVHQDNRKPGIYGYREVKRHFGSRLPLQKSGLDFKRLP